MHSGEVNTDDLIAYVLHSHATGIQLVKIQHFKLLPAKSVPSVFVDANVSGR